jgi:hypothetical protein
VEQLTNHSIQSLIEEDAEGLSIGEHVEIDLSKHLAPIVREETELPLEPTLDQEEILLTSNQDALTQQAYTYLHDALLKIGCGAKRVNRDIQTFKEFVLFNKSPLTIIENIVGRNRYDFANARISEPAWRFLADVALRLEACTSSEVSCERTISAQRLILTCHNLRSDKRLLEARLTLMKGFEK